MATTHTWTGAVNNDAANAANWQGGAPAAGDSLAVNGTATLDISGNALKGDQLAVSEGYGTQLTLNLSHHAVANVADAVGMAGSVVVNVEGQDTLNLTTPQLTFGNAITVNLADHAKLDGAWNLNDFETATIHGGKGSEFEVSTQDIIRGTSMVIDTDVGGCGTFIVDPGAYHYGPPGGGLEFGGKVGNGVHVDLNGTGYQWSYGSAVKGLVIDHPDDFKGSITLHAGGAAGSVDLKDMARAASWSFKNDPLTIADAKGHAIDKLRIDDQASGFNGGLALSRSATGDVLVSPGTDFHGLLALPTS